MWIIDVHNLRISGMLNFSLNKFKFLNSLSICFQAFISNLSTSWLPKDSSLPLWSSYAAKFENSHQTTSVDSTRHDVQIRDNISQPVSSQFPISMREQICHENFAIYISETCFIRQTSSSSKWSDKFELQ